MASTLFSAARRALGRAGEAGPLRRAYGTGPPGGFFGEGVSKPQGYMYGETPPKPGEWRQAESWELPWNLTFYVFTPVVLGLGLSAKPDSSYVSWGKWEAKRRSEEA